jgi:hypothetical protein
MANVSVTFKDGKVVGTVSDTTVLRGGSLSRSYELSYRCTINAPLAAVAAAAVKHDLIRVKRPLRDDEKLARAKAEHGLKWTFAAPATTDPIEVIAAALGIEYEQAKVLVENPQLVEALMNKSKSE